MKTCHEIQREFVEALYGDLDPVDQAELDTHLGACIACATEFSSLRSTLDVMDRREPEEPGTAFWQEFADGVRAAVADGERRKEPQGPGPRPWPVRREPRWVGLGLPVWGARVAAAIAILAVGITIGRLSSGSAPTGIVGSDTIPTARIDASAVALNQQVSHYMERCRTLLLGIVNLDPAANGFDAFDLEPHQDLSRQLAREAPVLHRDLAGSGERRLARLVLELQEILIQIANLESPERVEGLRVVREDVQQRALLFKIHLESTRPATGSGDSEARGAI